MDWEEAIKDILRNDIAYLVKQEDIAILDNLTTDDSDFVVVDGEEGDYGVIRFSDADGRLFATRIVEGGDSESLETTPLGRRHIANILQRKIEQWANQIDESAHNQEQSL